MSKNYQVVVIGGGPGGYVAAIRAAQLGLKTCLVEKEHLGGICLNWGCIPTKTLLRSSEINHLLQRASEFGFKISKANYDLDKIVKRSRDVAGQLSTGIKHLLKKNKIDVFMGEAQFSSSTELLVNSEKIRGEHLIIATGARARILPGFEPDDEVIMTYKQAMVPKSLPKRLLVVGSGAIGVEFASFYHNLGSAVTIVEVKDCILPVEDSEVSQFMEKSLTAQGIKICTSSTVKSIKKSKKSAEVTIQGSKDSFTETFDAVIMAVGIQGNIENLGLEHTNVKTDRGSVVTDEWCKTDDKNIYAIGDVAGAPWLAHKASHEGIICVEKIAGASKVKPLKKHLVPGCTYSMPQIASIGLTEQSAKEKGLKVRIGKFPFIANGKAIAIGETEGFVKTIFDEKTGELLGAHMVGAEVTEMIQGYALAMTLEATEEELMHTIFPHPTLSEAMHESVLAAFSRPLHI